MQKIQYGAGGVNSKLHKLGFHEACELKHYPGLTSRSAATTQSVQGSSQPGCTGPRALSCSSKNLKVWYSPEEADVLSTPQRKATGFSRTAAVPRGVHRDSGCDTALTEQCSGRAAASGCPEGLADGPSPPH